MKANKIESVVATLVSIETGRIIDSETFYLAKNHTVTQAKAALTAHFAGKEGTKINFIEIPVRSNAGYDHA